MIFSVLVLCTQVNMIFVMLLSVYPHRASLKNMPGPASIPKVVGSIPTVVEHIFQARPVWIYTLSNITNIIFT